MSENSMFSTVTPGMGFSTDELGGPFDAADRFDQSVRRWSPRMRSADSEMLPSKPLIDMRARDMVRNDAYLRGGQNLHKDNIVGAYFMLNARPATRVIFGKYDDVWEQEFQQEVEELFDLWSDSPRHLCDASRTSDFTGLVRMVAAVSLLAGESLTTSEWIDDGTDNFKTSLQMVDLDRLSNDPNMPFTPYLRGGILFDQWGAPQLYTIRNGHPNDYPWFPVGDPLTWAHVSARNPWGRQQVIHLYEKDRPGQTRGMTELASSLKEMRMTHKFRDVQLQRAVLQSLYAAVITSDLDTQTVFSQIGQGGNDITDAFEEVAAGYLGAVGAYAGKNGRLKLDGVRIPHLYPGSKLELLSSGDTSPSNDLFETHLLRYIAASLGVSYEQFSRDYTNTNYSSARAAIAETEKYMNSRKKMFADRFANAAYSLWLEEAIMSDRLTTFPKSKAGMLYTNGVHNVRMEAICKAEWIGASRGQVDELKETQAAIMRINSGLGTLEGELSRLGKDWRRNLRQIQREKQMQASLGLTFTATGTMPRGGVSPDTITSDPAEAEPQPTPEEPVEPEDKSDSSND